MSKRVSERMMCEFANPASYSVIDSGFKAYFGDRYRQLCDDPGFKEAQKIATHTAVPDNMRHYFPQGHPFWLLFRSEAQVTGSAAAELLGMHDSMAGAILHIPKVMYQYGPHNEAWDDFLERKRFPGMPSMGLDPPGNFYAAGGKFKESSALGTLLEYVPGMVYTEVGAIVITPEHLMRFNITNIFTGERITSLPFKLVISPDFDALVPLVVTDDDETQKDVEMVHVAGEIKTPTYFRVQDKSEAYGLHYRALGVGCVPYPRPKEYYLPQNFLEMLALGRDRCLVFSYTLINGGTAWMVDMDEEYLSMIMSLLIATYTTFVENDLPVPTNHDLLMPADSEIHQLYSAFLQRTIDICAESPIYMTFTHKQCDDFGVKMGYHSTDTFLTFPDYPRDVLHNFQRLQLFAFRLFRDWDRFRWVKAFGEDKQRATNILAAMDTPLTAFAANALHDVLYGTKVTGRYPEAARERPRVVSRVMDTAEGYLADVLEVIHEMYGSPPFGEPLNPAVFAANSAHAALEFALVDAPDGIACDPEYWTSLERAEPRSRVTPRMWEHAQVIYCIVTYRRSKTAKK